jgi:ferredoxin
MLRFAEAACVQCGLCKATCPESAIRLEPRIDIQALDGPSRVLKQEEPFCCTRCGKPFGSRSTIDRIVTMLQDKHWMYGQGDPRLQVLTQCADCRMKSAAEAQLGLAGPSARPAARTTDDYLRERDEGQDG